MWLRTASGFVRLDLTPLAQLPMLDPGRSTLLVPSFLEGVVPGRVPEKGPDPWNGCLEALALARGSSPETLALLVATALGPGADPDDPTPVPALLQLDVPAPPHAATAAHPRAFRGTTHKPPQDRLPSVVDLRPHALHRSRLMPLLQSLAVHVPAAMERLASFGLDRARLPLLAGALSSRKSLDPSLAYHQGLLLPPLPPRLAIMGSDLQADHVRPWSIAWAALDAESLPTLAWLLVRLHHQAGVGALAWAEAFARVAPPLRAHVLAVVLRAGAAAQRAPPDAIEGAMDAIGSFPNTGPDLAWVHRAMTWAVGWRDGLGEQALAEGLGWQREWAPTARIEQPPATPTLSRSALERLWERIGPNEDSSWDSPGRRTLHLWSLSGRFPGLAEMLESADLWDLDDATFRGWIERLIRTFPNQDCDEQMTLYKWRVVSRLAPDFLQWLKTCQLSHRVKAIELLSTFIVGWDDRDTFERLLRRSLAVIRALCQPWAPADWVWTWTWSYLVELLSEPDLAQVLERPQGLWALERASEWENDSRLITRGVERLLHVHPRVVRDGIIQFPRTLARTARRAGVMREAWTEKLLLELRSHAVMDPALDGSNLDGLWRVIEANRAAGVHGMLPRRIRMELGRGLAPSAKRAARAVEKARHFLPLARLQIVNQALLERIKGSLPGDVDNPGHRVALEMAQHLRTHRRALRRFLKDHLGSAQPRPTHLHEANQKWLRTHPAVNIDRWLKGVEIRGVVPGRGEVTLAFEHDPLEVLRLGQYVATCLGVGGLCDESAAAVMLDVNKRVVYARDNLGRVVARQLICITSTCKVDCFSPYPEWARSSPEMSRAFREFDAALAAAMSLSLAQEQDEGYVESIVTRDFWYDGTWTGT